jgi:hypothetical protein
MRREEGDGGRRSVDGETAPCAASRGAIQSLLDGALAEPERRALDAHAAQCAACAAALAGARLLAARLAAWPHVVPSADFAARVMGTVAARRRRALPALPARVPLALAGVAALITLALVTPAGRRLYTEMLIAGADRGADDAVRLARGVSIALACLMPLVERAAAALAPIAALARAIATSLLHVGGGPIGLGASVVAAAAVVVVLHALLSPRERRGLHVLVF